MADNFLEKRMDDYARGRLTASRARTSGLKCIKIPAVRVLVVNADRRELLIKALAEAGYKAAFTLRDSGEGAKMAQATGGRFYPCDAGKAYELLATEGDKPAGIVAATAAEIDFPVDADTKVIILESDSIRALGLSEAATALMVIALLLPEATS